MERQTTHTLVLSCARQHFSRSAPARIRYTEILELPHYKIVQAVVQPISLQNSISGATAYSALQARETSTSVLRKTWLQQPKCYRQPSAYRAAAKHP